VCVCVCVCVCACVCADFCERALGQRTWLGVCVGERERVKEKVREITCIRIYVLTLVSICK